MKRRRIEWRWEDPEAQASFVEWVGFPDAAATAREVDRIESLLALTPRADLLDVGCGTGRHAVELAKCGYRVVGIDIAGTYIAEAERAVARAGVPVELRLQRAAQLTETARYDAALAINLTLGFMDDVELAAQFTAILRALRPGGRFLLQTAGPQCRPGATPGPVRNWGEKDGRFILSEKRLAGRLRIEDNIVIDTIEGEIFEFHEEQRAFARDEVVGLLRSAGFRNVRCAKDLSGATATDDRFGVYLCRR